MELFGAGGELEQRGARALEVDATGAEVAPVDVDGIGLGVVALQAPRDGVVGKRQQVLVNVDQRQPARLSAGPPHGIALGFDLAAHVVVATRHRPVDHLGGAVSEVGREHGAPVVAAVIVV